MYLPYYILAILCYLPILFSLHLFSISFILLIARKYIEGEFGNQSITALWPASTYVIILSSAGKIRNSVEYRKHDAKRQIGPEDTRLQTECECVIT